MTPPDWHANWYVRYNGSASYSAGTDQEHKGYEAAQATPKDVFNNVTSVGVAAGATIVTTDDVTIKGLSVDATGAGTIDGFKFAASGVLNVENAPSGSFVLPGTYANVEGFGNIANWSLAIGGKPTTKRTIRIDKDGRIIIEGNGLLLLLR